MMISKMLTQFAMLASAEVKYIISHLGSAVSRSLDNTPPPTFTFPEFGEINARNGFNRKLMPETLPEEELILKTRGRREKFWVRWVNTQYVLLSASFLSWASLKSMNNNVEDSELGGFKWVNTWDIVPTSLQVLFFSSTPFPLFRCKKFNSDLALKSIKVDTCIKMYTGWCRKYMQVQKICIFELLIAVQEM